MRRSVGAWVVVGVVALVAGSARAQSINVSFGHTSGGPSSTFAAAGAAGTWNTITGVSGSSWKLVDTEGAATSVTISQSPTTSVITNADSALTGDDAKLLNSGLLTTGAETCLFFGGFKPGTYEVLVYAWVPNQPKVKSRTRQDEAASTIDVGGAWNGSFVEGTTYARYVVTVDSSGSLPAHSGLVPGAPSAALNGVQVRLMSEVEDMSTKHTDASMKSSHDAAMKEAEDASVAKSQDDAGVATQREPDASVATSGSDAGVAVGPAPDLAVAAHGREGGCSTTPSPRNDRANPSAIIVLAALFFVLRRARRSLA